MTKEEAIKYLQQLYFGGSIHRLDEQYIEAISMAIEALRKEPAEIDFEQELYKAFGQVKDFTLGMQIAKWFYDMGKNSQEPASIWHDASEKPERENLLIETNDGRIIHRQSINNYGMVKRWAYISVLLNLDNSCNFGKNSQEPVSEDEIEKQFKAGDVVVYVSRQPAYSGLYLLANPNDLSIGYSNANEPYQIALRNCTVASEDERKQFMRRLYSNGYKWNEDTLRIEKEEPVSEDLEEAAEDCGIRQGAELKPFAIKFFKAGAMWQKQQDQSTIELAEDHAMLAGMEKMKEEMMEKAIECELIEYPDGTLAFQTKTLTDDDIKARGICMFDYDKVKLIIVKGD